MATDSRVSSHAPSVLLRFAGENIRSFRDEFEISLISTSLAEPGVVRDVQWRSGSGQANRIGVLPSAAVFGANASGKTNLLRALDDMRSTVLQSFRHWSPTGGTRRRPFLLDAKSAGRPSRYEIDLVLDGVRHEYGFVLDDERVVEEWALRYPHGRAQLMFERDGDDFKIGASMSSTAGAAAELVRENSLLVSAAAALRANELRPLYEWFQRNLRMAEAGSRAYRQAYTVKLLEDEGCREQVLALLCAADLGVVGAETVKPDPEIRERMERAVRVLTEGEEVEVDLDEVLSGAPRLIHQGEGEAVAIDFGNESLGTMVWLGLVGPIVDALANGSVLLADELDASLHPELVAQVVSLFQDQETNPRRAQLLFNSHDSTLLGDTDSRVVGRDQVWFTEKINDGSTRLYPLSAMGPRKAESVGKRYLEGRYGAVPITSAAEFAQAAEQISAARRR